MNTLAIAPMQWMELKDIDNVEPLNDDDALCLAEVREVLKKHGKLDRFGVALLHSHFDLADDEILMETSDKEARSLTIRPTRVSEAATESIGTIWMLCDGDIATMAACKRYCRRWGLVGHDTGHHRSK